MYKISSRQNSIAKELGVEIRPSENKKKKIDVYKNGKFVTSVGASDYGDYFIFLNTHDKEFAQNRRRLYDLRTKSKSVLGSPNWYARHLLWDLKTKG